MALSAADLDARHGRAGAVAFRDSPLGGVVAELRAAGATALVALRGGQVLHYVPRDGIDVLWLSPLARLDGGKAVRGGIPVCWPWFGPHPTDAALPAHGVARTANWDVVSASHAGDAVGLRLALPPPGENQAPAGANAPWRQLGLTLDVVLGAALEIALETRNHGGEPVAVSQALHTYLRVGDIGEVRIGGLAGCHFVDQVERPWGAADTSGARLTREDGALSIVREVDRIYVGTRAPVVVDDLRLGRRITVAKAGSASTVIWNPWIDKATRLGDLGPDGYRRFVCVETANAASDLRTIGAGGAHVLGTSISVAPLG